MKITAFRKLLILMNVLLLAGIGWSVYGAWTTKQEVEPWKQRRRRDLQARLDAIPPSERVVLESKSYVNDLKGSGNLWSNTTEKPPAPVTQTKPVEAPVDNTPLAKLVEVVSIKSGYNGYAYLKPPTGELPAMTNRFFGENEDITFVPGAFVKKLQPRSVICMYNGKEQVLQLKMGSDMVGSSLTAGAGGSTPSGPAGDPAAGITFDERNGVVQIAPSSLQAIHRLGDEEVLKDVRWDTERLDDGKPAIKVTHIPQNSPLRKGGMMEGDTLVSINDHRMTSKAQAVGYVKANPNLGRYVVKFLRKGRMVTRVVTPKSSP